MTARRAPVPLDRRGWTRRCGPTAAPAPRPRAGPPRRALLVLLAGLVASGGAALSGAGRPSGPRPAPAWFHRGWKWRRELAIPARARKGEPVLARVGTAGLARPDARDLRIVVDHRVAIPYEILEVGPGDVALLAFPLPIEDHAIHVYLGNPAAPASRPPRRLAEGLRLEVWKLPEGTRASLEDVVALLRTAERSGPPAVLLARTISVGVPPLGLSGGFLARYRGVLAVREGGEYLFETVSDGASFFRVHGKLVASWPGDHDHKGYRDPAQRTLHSGRVRLEKGLHWAEYTFAASGGALHVLAWQPPGAKRPVPVPRSAWLPWRRAEAGPLEALPAAGAEPPLDFTWHQVSDTNGDLERHDLAEVELRVTSGLEGRWAGRARWDFGDGQSGEGKSVRHVYLRHGVYPVRLAVSLPAGGDREAVRRVGVRFESLERGDLDALLEGYYRSTRSYDLSRLPPEHLRQLIWLRQKDARWRDDLRSAVDAWFRRGLPATEPELARLGLERALERLRGGHRDAGREALAALERVATQAPGESRRREARAWRLWAGARGKGEEEAEKAARELARLAAEAGKKDDAARRARLLEARLEIERGRFDRAREIVEPLEEEESWRRYEGARSLASGARRLGFDSLLGAGKLEEAREELDRWEWELPRDLLDGPLFLARARWLERAGRAKQALGELERFRKVPGAREALLPRSWLLEAKIRRRQGDASGSRRALQRVIDEFPRRPEAEEAREKLAGGGRRSVEEKRRNAHDS